MAKDVTQTMDLTQAAQTVKWLDEERRKDKATIAALEERTKAYERQLSQQASQIQELQTAVASVQSLIAQVTGFEQVVSNYKAEMTFLLDQREAAWKKERAESDRLRKMELETIVDRLSGLDKAIQVLPRYDEDLKTRQAEERRLNEATQRLEVVVKDLDKRSDDRVQAVTYLEEQRRADNRRIAELEQETTDLRKKAEAQVAKLLLLEDTAQKQKSRVDEAVQELKKYDKPIEELRISDFQREQKVKQYLDQGAQVAEEMERIRIQTQGFLEQQQLVKRSLEKMEGFQARVEKRQNEVAEMQRLAEDRVKRQWEEWQADQDKEAKKRQILLDEQWRAQTAVNQEHAGRVGQLEAQAGLLQTALEMLFETSRVEAHEALSAAQDAVERWEQAVAQGRAILRGEQKPK